jgi:hypothetical protein
MKAKNYSRNITYNKRKRREATDGDVLDQWLRGVRQINLTPFFILKPMMSSMRYRTSCYSGEKLPLTLYYPIDYEMKTRNQNIETGWVNISTFLNSLQFSIAKLWYRFVSFSGTILNRY